MKNKEVITMIIVILFAVLAVCVYPIFIKVENGTMTCENLLGKEVKCMIYGR